jgi:catechol 2,3-dioxygenase-like lactoylglutathione lyase family enzyme
MIGYTIVGTNDLKRAGAFYDALMALIGVKRSGEMDRGIGWAKDDGTPEFWVFMPADGKPATIGNGSMLALALNNRDEVETMYKKALELGGKDEGAPGVRLEGYYHAYFRDLDGNKLSCFCVDK